MGDVTIEELVENLKNIFKKEKNKNYLYFSFFFLTFSFFLAFVIRLTIKSAFESKSKKEQLTIAVDRLEKVINKAVELQTQAEHYREDFILLSQAVPDKVKIAEIMKQLEDSFKDSNLVLVNASVSNINLVHKDKENKDKLKEVILDYTLEGKFSDYLKFLESIESQRRLKIIEESIFSREEELREISTGEAKLKIVLKVKTFFL